MTTLFSFDIKLLIDSQKLLITFSVEFFSEPRMILVPIFTTQTSIKIKIKK